MKDTITIDGVEYETDYEIPNDDTVIWRFLDLAKFVSLLKEKALYMTRADKFEDQFEGAVCSLENAERYDEALAEYYKDCEFYYYNVRYMDKEGKGVITKESMKNSLEEINVPITDEEIQKLFDNIDEDGSGVIEYQEFLRNVCNVQNLMSESNLRNVFHHVCGDKNVMTGEDVKRFVFHDEKVNENVLKEYFEEVGMKMEDTITFEEFFEMIKNNTKAKRTEEANDKDKTKDINKMKYKKKESKYAFKGPVIDEVKAEEEEVGESSPRNRKTYKEDEELGENGGIKENGEIKLNGIEKQDADIGDGNGNEKLSTVADTIVDNDDKMKQLDDVI